MTVLTAIVFLNGFLFAEEATIFRTDFDNPVLDKGWGWMPSPEGKTSYKIEKGRLVLINESGLGQWGKNPAAPKLMRKLGTEDVDVTVRMVEYNPVQKWEEAGMLLWQDDKNWFKLQIATNGRNVMLNCAGIIDGKEKQFTAPIYQESSIFFRIRKRKGTYFFQHSSDGKKFKDSGFQRADKYTSPMVGVFISRWPDHTKPNTARFEFFEIKKTASDGTAAQSDLIRNGSFDEGDLGWVLSEGAKHTPEGYSGSGVKLASKGGWIWCSQTVTGIKPNTIYTVSCRIRADRPTQPKVQLAKFKPQNGKSAFWPRVGRSWQAWSATLTSAPDCPETIVLELINRSGNIPVYYDEVRFFTRDYVQAEVVETIRHPGRELVKNGSFDKGAQSWAFGKNTQLVPTGRKGQCVELDSAGWVVCYQRVTGIKPNSKYKFRCWIKTSAKTERIPKVMFAGFKPKPGEMDDSIQDNGVAIYKNGLNAGTDWKEWTQTLTSAPRCPASFSLQLINRAKDAKVYFDDVSFTSADRIHARVRQKSIPEVAREGQNLISNWNFERVEQGKPAGWFQEDKGVMAVTADGKYFTDPSVLQGKCTIRSPGFQSQHAMAIAVKNVGAGMELNTQVHQIKPGTPYTISFWYRMPANNRLSVFLFGRELVVRRTYKYNPMHWCRFSEIVNSGTFSGDVNIGFGVNLPTDALEVWLDKVELFEGTSPIGNDVAKLWYLYYDKAYVSPDLVSPLMFMHEWNFGSQQKAASLRYVVEFPKEVEPVACSAGRAWGNPLSNYEVKRTEAEIGGKGYVRTTVYPNLKSARYYVPVEGKVKKFRDWWEWSFAANSGRVNLCWYAKSNVEMGTYPLYYYAEWDGGRQPRQTMNLEVTRVPKTDQPRRLLLMAGPQHQAHEKHPQLASDFQRIGLNGIDNWDTGPKSKFAEYRKLGVKHFGVWMVPAMYYSSDPESAPMDLNGKRVSTLDKSHGGFDNVCMEYRGQDWVKNMDRLKKLLEKGVNVFKFDDHKNCTCYCPKCQAVFSEFMKEHSTLKYIQPSVFMKPGWSGDADYKALWEDFPLWHYGTCAQDMKQELVAYARKMRIDDSIHFGVSSPLPFKNPRAASSLRRGFDYQMHQIYINCYTAAYEGSPKLAGDYSYKSQKQYGKHALPFAPTLEPGLTYMHPACSLDPYEQMKYQILEVMMAPKFAGYVMYDGKDTDLGDLKNMAEANAILCRFEDLLMDGQALDPIEIDHTTSIRIKRLGSEALVLVADYSTYEPEETTVEFITKALSSQPLVDVETGEKIAPTDDRYTVRISADRARVFHVAGIQ